MKRELYGFVLWFCLMLLLAVAFMGCMSDFDKHEISGVIVCDEARVHYDKFFEEAENRGVTIKERPVNIYLSDMVPTAAAANNKMQRIRLSREYFISNIADTNKEYVIFHELGHYLLDRGHDDRTNQTGGAVSIMHPEKVAYTVTKEHLRKGVLDDLFFNF